MPTYDKTGVRMVSMDAIAPLYADMLVKYQDVRLAAKAISISKEKALAYFWDADFRRVFLEKRRALIDEHLQKCRETLEYHQTLSHKDATLRTQATRLEKLCRDLELEKARSLDSIFPELRALLGEKWWANS